MTVKYGDRMCNDHTGIKKITVEALWNQNGKIFYAAWELWKVFKYFTCELKEGNQSSRDKFQEARMDLSGTIMTELTEFPNLFYV